MKLSDLQLSRLGITFDSRGHFRPFVAGVLEAGLSISALPANGLIQRNGQIVILETPARELRFRVYIYKVTVSSRGRPDERRVEITNTYPKRNIRRIRGAQDVVLGWDYENGVFIGLDPSRLEWGGPTGNASSFFDGGALRLVKNNEILVRQHRSSIFARGFEYHAFFRRRCIADYLASLGEIHSGQYRGETFLKRKAGPVRWERIDERVGDRLVVATKGRQHRQGVHKSLLESVEQGRPPRAARRCVSAKEFEEVKKTCEENGRLGEEFVLEEEKRSLAKAGRADLAAKVQWVSETSVFEGHDILSFFPDGRKKYIEVKSTSGDGNVFQLSSAEWEFGVKHGNDYLIYRVTQVRAKRPKLKTSCNLQKLEASGQLTKSASGWTITLN